MRSRPSGQRSERLRLACNERLAQYRSVRVSEGSAVAQPKKSTAKPGAAEPKAKRVTRKQAEEETKKFRFKAEKYKNDPEAINELLGDAQRKAKKQKGPLSGRFDDIMTLTRLVRAYVKGDYREVSWETVALAIGALIYFLSPVDLIPDVIPVVGYIDDAAVIGFVVASIYTDLNNFRDWEASQEAQGA